MRLEPTLSVAFRCIKHLMVVFNILFAITGIIWLLAGVFMYLVINGHGLHADPVFLAIPLIMIALGCAMFIISFFGCCGAGLENYCMIWTFTFLMMCTFILELAGGIAGYVLKGSIRQQIESNMLETMRSYNNGDADYNKWQTWDQVQSLLKCCGVNGPTDWEIVSSYSQIPKSCWYALNDCTHYPCQSTNDHAYYEVGCLSGLEEITAQQAGLLSSICLLVAFLQVMGILCSIYVIRGVKRSQDCRKLIGGADENEEY